MPFSEKWYVTTSSSSQCQCDRVWVTGVGWVGGPDTEQENTGCRGYPYTKCGLSRLLLATASCAWKVRHLLALCQRLIATYFSWLYWRLPFYLLPHTLFGPKLTSFHKFSPNIFIYKWLLFKTKQQKKYWRHYI